MPLTPQRSFWQWPVGEPPSVRVAPRSSTLWPSTLWPSTLWWGGGMLGLAMLLNTPVTSAAELSGRASSGGVPLAGALVEAYALASGTASVSGVVTDGSSGKPIAGATVYLDVPPAFKSRVLHLTTTDAAGRYTLSDLPAGAQTITVRHLGHTLDHAPRTLTAGQSLSVNFVLMPVTVEPEPLVTLFVDFPNLTFSPGHDKTYFDHLLYSDTPGVASVRNYFYEVSRGRMLIVPCASAYVTDTRHPYPHENADRDDIADTVLPLADAQVNYAACDTFDNRDRSPVPDGSVDHVLLITAGLPQSITGDSLHDMNPVAMWNTTTGLDGVQSEIQVLMPEYSPLGNFVHELFHDMGEVYVQDLYRATCDTQNPPTVGQWEVMDVGMYNPFLSFPTDPRDPADPLYPSYEPPCSETEPDCWFSQVGFAPAQPDAWTLLTRWYHGHYATIATSVTAAAGTSTVYTLQPWERGTGLQRIRIADPANASAAWYLTLRGRLGTDAGVRASWYEGRSVQGSGLVITYNDTDLSGQSNLAGPVRVRDSHPRSGSQPSPAFGCAFELDDAAFLTGETSTYQEGALKVEVLSTNVDGSLDIKVTVGAGLSASPLQPSLYMPGGEESGTAPGQSLASPEGCDIPGLRRAVSAGLLDAPFESMPAKDDASFEGPAAVQDSPANASGTTGPDGGWRLTGLEPGVYQLRVSAPSATAVLVRPLILQRSDDTLSRDVTLVVTGQDVCDGKDNDGDGRVDEDGPDASGDGTADCADDDGDGVSEDEGDCNDLDPAVNPNADEDQTDGFDNNCNGQIDETNGGGCHVGGATRGRHGVVGWGIMLGVFFVGQRLRRRR